MKNILITQSLYQDFRNNLYSKLYYEWNKYSQKNNFNLWPISHDISINSLKNIKYDGIIFSGGNSLNKYSKNRENKLRDRFEKKLLKLFIPTKVPKLFICRGMQLIADFYNIKLFKTNKHVRKNHKIIFNDNAELNVNSYHTFVLKDKPIGFNILAKHQHDNTIEIMENKKKKILCLMFHPERLSLDQKKIDKIFKNFFNLK